MIVHFDLSWKNLSPQDASSAISSPLLIGYILGSYENNLEAFYASELLPCNLLPLRAVF